MKALKIILFIIAVLILLFIILGFIGPKSFDVSRSIEYDAPVDMVYEQISNLSKKVEWDPWKEEDPDMKITINGSGDEVGSYRRWESENSVGEEWLVELVPNESVESELKFISPFELTSTGYQNLEKLGDNRTNMTMGIKGENSFMMRAMSMIPGMSMESKVGPMFKKGLDNLKEILSNKVALREVSVDNMKKTRFSFGIQEMPSRSFVLKRGTVAMSNIGIFYASNLGSIYTAVGVAGHEPVGKPCGIYYSWDEEAGTTDMCAAIPVADGSLRIEGYETVTIPASRMVKLPYYGSYEGAMDAHIAMGDYLKANDLVQNGPVIEEYITDPTTEPDTTKWLTNILYLIK